MNGTAHAAIGAAAGFITANTFQSTPTETAILIGLGTVSALVPDLDIDGKLRGRITLSHKVIQAAAQIIGMLMIFYSLYEGEAADTWIGIGIGVAMITISSLIKQRHMLTVTGVGVIACGVSLQEPWLIMLGIYIFVASFVSHRGYTHSIAGIIFYGMIAYGFEASVQIDGAYLACLTGYISHLAADMKIFPINKRGIKLFLPVSSKEV
ncbi:metal-dependent hydrolase [Cytobacillus purgationiresistens]|uniref:Inner membrane protein n=1 Tax=Cytobacillus purgationiresistens TaxID=863449 RepID=A0ABU0AJD6_9BACI|nr:metal-dependent hydrolase [Cytobacillus purgationiresistens]MDQ0271376.1 inner membrane protein [Cytobacillus purgationiresistens]